MNRTVIEGDKKVRKKLKELSKDEDVEYMAAEVVQRRKGELVIRVEGAEK